MHVPVKEEGNIRDCEGNLVTKQNLIMGVVDHYFQKLFSSSSTSNRDIELHLQHMQPNLTPSMNLELQRDFSKSEVEVALNQMVLLNYRNPLLVDLEWGQACWGKIGDQISQAVLNLLNGKDKLDPNTNFTYLVMIPNIDKMITAYEVLHSMKSRKKRKLGNMALKLDLSKAYDRIK